MNEKSGRKRPCVHLKYYPSIFLGDTGENLEMDNHPDRNLKSESSRYERRALTSPPQRPLLETRALYQRGVSAEDGT
jgi:hypothetical protein